jgi:hypothetical protein
MNLQKRVGREIVTGVLLGALCLSGILSFLNHFESRAIDTYYSSSGSSIWAN